MIRKTDKVFKTKVNDYGVLSSRTEKRTIQKRRETWWLLWILPVYTRETIVRGW